MKWELGTWLSDWINHSSDSFANVKRQRDMLSASLRGRRRMLTGMPVAYIVFRQRYDVAYNVLYQDISL